jgi:Trypsin-co-occurring domain 2
LQREVEALAEIGIVDAIAGVRSELGKAIAQAGDGIQFPVEGVELEFKVAVTKSRHGDGKVNIWVLELGGGLEHEQQAIHTVRLRLGSPVDERGQTLKVRKSSTRKP